MGKKSKLLFSQRKGLKPIKKVLQIDSMDDDLRNSLWSASFKHYWGKLGVMSLITKDPHLFALLRLLWNDYFKYPIDNLVQSWSNTRNYIRKYFFKCPWNEVYDFIEFIANNYSIESTNKNFIEACNLYLERELSAFRFVGGNIVEISSKEEIAEIEEALKADFLKPVKSHIKSALNLLADRESPDYRNSIKESISAVEAICRIITKKKKATLSDALKEIEKKIEIHGALKEAFNKLYGYTSDEQGIRHSLLDESNLSFEDAKFMLVVCSAFINYLILKSAKAEIEFS